MYLLPTFIITYIRLILKAWLGNYLNWLKTFQKGKTIEKTFRILSEI